MKGKYSRQDIQQIRKLWKEIRAAELRINTKIHNRINELLEDEQAMREIEQEAEIEAKRLQRQAKRIISKQKKEEQRIG